MLLAMLRSTCTYIERVFNPSAFVLYSPDAALHRGYNEGDGSEMDDEGYDSSCSEGYESTDMELE